MVDNCSLINHLLKLGNCLTCRQLVSLFDDFCPDCLADLPFLEAHCSGCGKPAKSQKTTGMRCGQCQKQPRPFSKVHALFRYQEPVSTYIHQLKYRNRLDLTRSMGELMANHIQSIYSENVVTDNHTPDLLIPVPLHPARLITRGYNQALELARPVAKKLSRPLDYNSLKRIRDTKPQMELAIKERKKNVQKAFVVNNHSVKGKSIALIDDVFTTGQTAEAATHALLDAGASAVECWVLARAGIH